MAGKYRNLYYNLCKYCFSLLPDTLYHNLLGFIMHRRFGVKYHWMNIHKPRTFSEKLQWLKTHGDLSIKTKLADKYDVRKWVKDKIGENYLVNLLPLNSHGDLYVTSTNEIDWDSLPNEFVLKLTKGSGYNFICKDKTSVNCKDVLKNLEAWLKVNNYYLSREPQYKGQNKIICERLLEFNICDYKFFCFNGVPRYLKVDIDRFSNHHANYYDCEWNLLSLSEVGCPRNADIVVEKPRLYQEMISIAKKLSDGFTFVRVDLYEHAGRVYFGEMTFCPAGGYAPYLPDEWEKQIGDMIKL